MKDEEIKQLLKVLQSHVANKQIQCVQQALFKDSAFLPPKPDNSASILRHLRAPQSQHYQQIWEMGIPGSSNVCKDKWVSARLSVDGKVKLYLGWKGAQIIKFHPLAMGRKKFYGPGHLP